MNTTTHRLLYRGALSLPDSDLLLDGITFTARLDAQPLLDNPLALALESMRGRPSLRFLGAVQLRELCTDACGGGVAMDVHPYATLTRIYFENMFCLTPIPSSSKSTVGVKIALGDSDGPETTHIVIYAHAPAPDAPLTLSVARITPYTPSLPSAARMRAPRPDDPTPRKPPRAFMRARQEQLRGLKRAPSMGSLDPTAKRARMEGAAGLGSGVRVGQAQLQVPGAFKVPALPGGKGKQREGAGDVFSVGGDNDGPVQASTKGEAGAAVNPGEMEKVNKTTLKKLTLHHLTRGKDPTQPVLLAKTHPEFKEVYTAVYRGAAFALREVMTRAPVDVEEAQRLIATHAEMYLPRQQ
ncbi:hypothetical protein BD779DRAFT_1681099 [Infundibulicybe gibba]|nr:hypothetical protein BD779DRAFT_1681099 [Infundibulicybe gibba]